MKIKVLPGSVVDTGKKVYQPGDTLELKKEEALKLIRKRVVRSVQPDKPDGKTNKTNETK